MAVPKQILVVRSDLRNTKGEKIRTGKIVAQSAHASLKAILDYGHHTGGFGHEEHIIPLNDSAIREWITGIFTKVCVVVNSEAELESVYSQAKEAGLICSLIIDSGLTEFGGVPTKTVAAIGPAYPDELQPITGHLKLL